MLVIISDLHFCDGTASEKNVDPDVFAIALRDIYADASAIAAKNKTCQLDIVMLGDVFDLLRTTRWFEVPVAERPWGSAAALEAKLLPADAPALKHAHDILKAIIDKNGDALDMLNGKSKDPRVQLPGKDVTIRRIMLTGNHDRLALHDEALHQKMRVALGAVDERTVDKDHVFPHRLEMPQYGLLARHGHEWDFFNFEAFQKDRKGADYDDTQYLPAPIGDPITTELAARLPYEMNNSLCALDKDHRVFTAEEKGRIIKRLQRVDDVRPLLASIQWVYQEVVRIHESYKNDKHQEDKQRVLGDALDQSVRKIVSEFKELEYYKAWLEKHDPHPILDILPDLLTANPAAMFKHVLNALLDVRIGTVEKLAPAFGPILERFTSSDDNRAGAGTEHERDHLKHLGKAGLRFVVYGHTHDAEQVALSADTDTQDMYLNSGTFRQRILLTDDRKGFIASDYISYIYFCTEEEAATWRDANADVPVHGPSYSAWTGLQSR